jgi:hypothetical protein
MTRAISGALRAAVHGRRAAALLCAGLVLALVLALTLVLAASGAGDGGFQLNPSGGLAGFGNFTGPGVPADFSGFVGPSSVQVTLLSATLLPIPGFPVPRLVHVGVHPVQEFGDVGEANYWPPRLPPLYPGGAPITMPVAAFHGYRLTPGRHSSLLIFYSFAGSRPGVDYFAAGLRVTYRVGQTDYTGNWYAYGSSCVTTPWNLTLRPRKHCSSAQASRAVAAYTHMAKQG